MMAKKSKKRLKKSGKKIPKRKSKKKKVQRTLHTLAVPVPTSAPATATIQMKRPVLILTIVFAVIAVLLALLITITLLISERPLLSERFEPELEEPDEIEKIEVAPSEFIIKTPLPNATQAKMYLPAVNDKGKGVMTLLVLEAIPGSGRTLVDIDNLLFWADTQHSIRIAKNVAANLTKVDIENYDLVYNIYANASVIGGESAGAAITIATIAVLLDKTPREDVVITGTINHDGTIGPVQGILPKAEVAKAMNASMLLVPLLQSQEVIYEEREHCEKFGPTEVCTTERIPKKVNIKEETGIDVIEVESIQEALKYFFE